MITTEYATWNPVSNTVTTTKPTAPQMFDHAIDGQHIIAVKRVNADFTSIMGNHVVNAPGTTVSLPEAEWQLCGHGLHFGSPSYVEQFCKKKGTVLIAVRIDPKDIKAVDPSQEKAIASRYVVEKEVYPWDADPRDVLRKYQASGSTDTVFQALAQYVASRKCKKPDTTDWQLQVAKQQVANRDDRRATKRGRYAYLIATDPIVRQQVIAQLQLPSQIPTDYLIMIADARKSW